MPDYFENVLGTDKMVKDTDGDGLTDGFEVLKSKTNPMMNDSDSDRTMDGDEDFDQDGLTNLVEYQNNTDPLLSDSDADGLSDYQEIKELHTNPLLSDSDADGLYDSDELEYSMDPLNKDTLGDGVLDGNRVFSIKNTGEISDNGKIIPKLAMELEGWQIHSLSIDKVENTDNFLNGEIPGFIGNAYDLNVEGDFPQTGAILSFEIDREYFEDSDFEPAIYYWDEESQILEELKNQSLNDNILSAELEHFSKYIVLAKNIYGESLFEYEIQAPTGEELQSKSFDVMLVLDESGSISSSNFSMMKELCIGLLDDFNDSDKIGVVTFDDNIRVASGLTQKDSILPVLEQLVQHNGTTAIYDAIYTACQEFEEESPSAKIVIALTDGKDNSSNRSYSAIAQTAKDSNIIVYTIGVGSSVSTNALISIAENTGGQYYAASNFSELAAVFNRVISDADLYKDSDEDGLSDYHEKCIMNGTLKTGSGAPVVNFSSLNYLNEDSDGDQLTDGEEITIKAREIDGKTVYYCYINSNPCIVDSDSDGINDMVESYAGLEPLVNNAILNTQNISPSANQRSLLDVNTFWQWYELIGDYAWNYIHNAVEADIILKNPGTESEYSLYSKTGKVTGRIDILRDSTGEIWDVKPASYQSSPKKEVGLAQLARYIILGSEEQNGPILLKIGGSYVSSSTVQAGRYSVEYTNMQNGLVCYHFTRNVPIIVPVPELAPSKNPDKVDDVEWYEYLWKLAKEVGYNAQEFGKTVYACIEKAVGYVSEHVEEIIATGVTIGGIAGIVYIIVHLLPLLPAVAFAV